MEQWNNGLYVAQTGSFQDFKGQQVPICEVTFNCACQLFLEFSVGSKVQYFHCKEATKHSQAK